MAYGATVALEQVDFDVCVGEVHALVGENGAGKSTLLRVLAGAERGARGARHLAAAAQLAWVPQEAELPADLRVEEWIFLAAELCSSVGWLQRRAMREQAMAALQRVGCSASPQARLGELSASQRKQVQLARALRATPAVLLLDEPTAVLGAAEAAQLFSALRALVAGGTAVVYVSHRLDEVLALADRVTVLRDGRRVCTDAIGAVDAHELVQRMVGREIRRGARGTGAAGAEALRVHDLAVGRVRGLSFALRAGEI
ncbi:MAG: ATP-binding cassette domain-containing protein, partial [Candidatus Binatia bacterium]